MRGAVQNLSQSRGYVSMEQDVRESAQQRDSVVLTSWKEIAAYLGKGVRTLQRWERELEFPLHRPDAQRGVVIAYPHEIDAWIKRRSDGSQPPSVKLQRLFLELDALVELRPELRQRALELSREFTIKLEAEPGSVVKDG